MNFYNWIREKVFRFRYKYIPPDMIKLRENFYFREQEEASHDPRPPRRKNKHNGMHRHRGGLYKGWVR